MDLYPPISMHAMHLTSLPLSSGCYSNASIAMTFINKGDVNDFDFHLQQSTQYLDLLYSPYYSRFGSALCGVLLEIVLSSKTGSLIQNWYLSRSVLFKRMTYLLSSVPILCPFLFSPFDVSYNRDESTWGLFFISSYRIVFTLWVCFFIFLEITDPKLKALYSSPYMKKFTEVSYPFYIINYDLSLFVVQTLGSTITFGIWSVLFLSFLYLGPNMLLAYFMNIIEKKVLQRIPIIPLTK